MIWRVADEQFPGAIEIVDIYHAKQHLCDVAKAIYGAGTDLAGQWAKDRYAELDAGRLRALVAALAPTPSLPCAAAGSAAASRISGSVEPQTPPEGHLTNLTCTHRPGADLYVAGAAWYNAVWPFPQRPVSLNAAC